ncbi:sugar phosphate nucleotidyltransferase [Mesorhizobium sp. BE184]|uniref:sugar nucleotidyltransferase n=1 Tax=Mesorhizobium sp. BE184 TaxID=2817714 RepID=UPI0028649F87|nr:sugar phosphate nucleotidyltransferase [Mesorhizobium sp. BE184]MDR7033329.1 glucose-1-phosphate thymidylyltransferase [Mesorhizobium sp. BE184]
MVNWCAVIMAGGSGSRLEPLTRSVNKHLLPVYDKPMIYFPLTTLMLGGLRDFFIVTSPEHVPQFEALLGDGSHLGISITMRVQENPGGIAECFRICQPDIGERNVALILGDNIFYGAGLTSLVQRGLARDRGATIYGYEVADASSFGVVTLGDHGRAVSLIEKPTHPGSQLAVPGLYFYDNRVATIAAQQVRSGRGELEITDINRAYLELGELYVERIMRGIAWLDGGTPDDLFEAGQLVRVLEKRAAMRIACPEEVALRKGFVTSGQLRATIATYPNGSYKAYLTGLLDTVDAA